MARNSVLLQCSLYWTTPRRNKIEPAPVLRMSGNNSCVVLPHELPGAVVQLQAGPAIDLVKRNQAANGVAVDVAAGARGPDRFRWQARHRPAIGPVWFSA